MKMSNNPGIMMVTLNAAGNKSNLTFNEIAGYVAGDGIIFLNYVGVKIPMSAAPVIDDDPESYVLTFGPVTLTYAKPDTTTVTVTEE